MQTTKTLIRLRAAKADLRWAYLAECTFSDAAANIIPNIFSCLPGIRSPEAITPGVDNVIELLLWGAGDFFVL